MASVCRAGFRNFGRPIVALPEMRRVVRPGVGALVIEQRKDATDAEIDLASTHAGRLADRHADPADAEPDAAPAPTADQFRDLATAAGSSIVE